MKSYSQKPLGALHPILFFTGIYFVALIFSIFICSAIFYSCNSTSASKLSVKTKNSTLAQSEKPGQVMVIAAR